MKYSGLWIVLATIVHVFVLWYVVRPILRLVTKRVNRKGACNISTLFLIPSYRSVGAHVVLFDCVHRFVRWLCY